jgi:hypothetical protein
LCDPTPADKRIVAGGILDGRFNHPLYNTHTNVAHYLGYAGWYRKSIGDVNTNGKFLKQYAVLLTHSDAHPDNPWQG